MTKETIFSGFGGQGVLMMGYVLAVAAMNEGMNVTYLPTYGAEVRGGTANCTVLLSDEPIGSPVVDNPTALVAMNLPSLDRFEKIVDETGIIVVNSSLITRPIGRNDVRAICVPANEIAVSLGNSRSANMVALGAVVKATESIPLKLIKSTMARMLGHNIYAAKLIEVNEQALDAGYNAV